jgi:hypothetical protein
MRSSSLALVLAASTSVVLAGEDHSFSLTITGFPKPSVTGPFWGKPTHGHHSSSTEDCDDDEPETTTDCDVTSTIVTTVTSTIPCGGPPCQPTTWVYSYPITVSSSTPVVVPTTPASIPTAPATVPTIAPCMGCGVSTSKTWPNSTIVTSSKATPSLSLNVTATPTPKQVSGSAKMTLGSVAAALIGFGMAMATL